MHYFFKVYTTYVHRTAKKEEEKNNSSFSQAKGIRQRTVNATDFTY